MEVTSQSWFSRMFNSIFMAICVAPLVILLCCGILGWNEKRAVCDERAITEGKTEVVKAGCDTADSSGNLVMFQCHLQRTGLPNFSAGGDFAENLSFEGVGLRTTAEMMQCVEQSHSKTTKTSGGGSITETYYTYSKEWRKQHIDSSNFKRNSNFNTNCGMDNPAWPVGAPTDSTMRASTAMVGPYTIPASFVDDISLDKTLLASSPPVGWIQDGSAYVKPPTHGGGAQSIGAVRVAFFGNDWGLTMMTVLGEHVDGTVDRWTASNSWMCSGFTLGTLREGMQSKDALFSALHAEASSLTWMLRVIFLLGLWCACSALFKPLEVAADCIPCIGPFLGDSIALVTCCIACPMGFACGFGVIGIVWVFMRPLVGLPLLIIFCLCIGGGLAFKIYSKQKKSPETAEAPDPESGAETRAPDPVQSADADSGAPEPETAQADQA